MSLEYSITRGVGNRRGQRKPRVVSPVMGQAGCTGREPDCLKPAGTWVGVSACMCNDLNHLETGPRRVAEAKVGTREQGISTRIHVADSHEDRAEDGRKSDRRHSANSLWERVDSCMSVGASIVIAYVGGRGEGVSLSTGVRCSTEVGN